MELGSLPLRTGPLRLLAISGSLRSASSNSLVLQAAQALAPPEVQVEFFRGLAELPAFNPDIDTDDDRPTLVRAFRAQIAVADGLLISTPEYAHGIPGALKNALDWLVSGPEFPSIPIALLNPSPRGTFAQAAVLETLTTMSGEVVSEASVTIPLSGRPLTLSQILEDAALADPLHDAMAALAFAMLRVRERGRRLVP